MTAPRRGVDDVFREVYEAEYDWVKRALARLGVRSSELEDVAHDVFVAVYRHLDAYDPSRPLKPWLYAFVFRVAAGHRRKGQHRSEAPGEDAESHAVDARPLADAQLDEARLRAACVAALDAMDFDKRALFVAFELEGQTAPDLAALLEIPVNTVYSRVRLARADFERQLEKVRTRR